MLQPVGPLPPSVYWRRRGVAAAAAVLAFALLVWAIAAATSADGGADASAAAPPPAAAPTTAPPAPVASLGALPAPRPAGLAAGQPGPALTPSGAAVLLGPGGLPVTRPQTATGPLTGTAALPGADAVSGAGIVTAAPTPGAPAPGAPPAPAASSAPTTAPPAPPPPPAAAPATAPCGDGDLRVVARTDKPRYAPGEHPLFSLVVTNTGSVPCVRDLDAARQAMAVVRKPGDGLWGSNDCSPAHSSDVRTLAPGQETVFSVRWGGRTSEPGCTGQRAVVPPGDYQLLTRLDGTVSAPARFTLS